LEVSQRFPVHRKVGKTAPLLRESSAIPLVDVPVLSTSPKVTKSQKVLATLKRLRFEPLFFPERFSENIKGHGVACKQVGRQAGVSPIVSVRFHYLPSVARDDQFTLRAFPSHSSNSPTNIERLHVLMLVPVHLGRHRTEP
jgi:hypothetical protein